MSLKSIVTRILLGLKLISDRPKRTPPPVASYIEPRAEEMRVFFNKWLRAGPSIAQVTVGGEVTVRPVHGFDASGYDWFPPVIRDFNFPTRTEWPIIKQVFSNWCELKDDWDCNGAKAIDERLLDTVDLFIRLCEDYGVPEPKPCIASDGEVGFIWHGKNRASTVFLPDGRFLALCLKDNEAILRVEGEWNLAIVHATLYDTLRNLNI
jgi:hypothetical protein